MRPAATPPKTPPQRRGSGGRSDRGIPGASGPALHPPRALKQLTHRGRPESSLWHLGRTQARTTAAPTTATRLQGGGRGHRGRRPTHPIRVYAPETNRPPRFPLRTRDLGTARSGHALTARRSAPPPGQALSSGAGGPLPGSRFSSLTLSSSPPGSTLWVTAGPTLEASCC